MLDEGVRSAFGHLGVDLRTVAYGEWEAPAASQLVALMEAGLLDAAPVWCGDFRRLPAGRFRGAVDAVVAGFPCQDMSVAGRRAGLNAGTRSGLFFSVVDFADDSGAWLLVLENVGGIVSATASVVDEEEGELEERAASRVVGELADRGWDAEWIHVSASDVGASHGRERWFCLAWRRGVSQADTSWHGRDGPHGEAGSGRGVCEAGEPVGHAVDSAGRWPDAQRSAISGTAAARPGGAVGHAPHDHGWRGVRTAEEGIGARGVGRRRLAGAGEPMADSAIQRRPEGRPEPGRIEGRPDAAVCGCAVADASGNGQHECEHAGAVVREASAQSRHEPQLDAHRFVCARADGKLADSDGGGPARLSRRRQDGAAECFDELADAGRARLPRGGGKRL